jgi:phage/plasmid-associated DNA primase
MFKVDVEDEGQLRRLLVAEMNAKFVSKAVYDASSEADKASGRIQLRDDTIIDRLKGNLEGVLKYFLDGASAYVADRFREPPPELFASKLKAVKDLDELARWIKGYIVKTGVATDSLSLRDIKAEWRSATASFLPTIREKGFNKQFFTKCERLGYTVRWDEDRSDEGKVMGVRLYDPSTDDAPVANGGGGGSPAGGEYE